LEVDVVIKEKEEEEALFIGLWLWTLDRLALGVGWELFYDDRKW
jgi:hypothetical protein